MHAARPVTEPSGDDAAAAPVGIRASTRYLPELESLRGIAIALVFLFHADSLVHLFQVQRPPPPLPLTLVRAGKTGVDLFFVLSAFLLTLPFVAEADHGRPVNLKRYFLRRGLRILPLYWAAVLPIIVLTAVGWRDVVHVLPLLVFVNAITPPIPRMFPYATVWWSLATESQFYLLLPAIRRVLRPPSGAWIGLGLFGVWALAYGLAVATPTLQTKEMTWFFSSLFGRFPVFVFGVVGAILYARRGARLREWMHQRSWIRLGGADVALACVVLALMVLLRRVTDDFVAERAPLVVWHVAGGALWAVFATLVVLAPLRCRPLLHNRALAWLGRVSYSVYLWHVPVIWQCLRLLQHVWPGHCHAWNLETGMVVAGISCVLLACAALSYRFIERPFLRYKATLD